jgi:hypothetical protein
MKYFTKFLLVPGAVAVVALLPPWSVRAVECELGEAVSVDIGDGVTLHSCSWERSPGEFVRTGPMEVTRNDILILKMQTDRDGKLQGEFSSWDDDGVLTEQGHYVDGLKHGEWRVTDANGNPGTVHYRGGVETSP